MSLPALAPRAGSCSACPPIASAAAPLPAPPKTTRTPLPATGWGMKCVWPGGRVRTPRCREGAAACVSDPGHGPDAVIAALAERQFGVVSVRQLLAAGVGRQAIATRARRHRLHRLHRGVYAVGHTALPPGARDGRRAGLWTGHNREPPLGGGPTPAAGRRRRSDRGDRDDSEPSQAWTGRPPLAHVEAADVRLVRGIPVTTPARTLIDFAETAKDRELERALGEALTLRLTSRTALIAAVHRAQGQRGAPRLRTLLDSGEPTPITDPKRRSASSGWCAQPVLRPRQNSAICWNVKAVLSTSQEAVACGIRGWANGSSRNK